MDWVASHPPPLFFEDAKTKKMKIKIKQIENVTAEMKGDSLDS